jgi:hypothetical protein
VECRTSARCFGGRFEDVEVAMLNEIFVGNLQVLKLLSDGETGLGLREF